MGKWGTLGHKYTFVKVGHIGAQIYICKIWAHCAKIGKILDKVGTQQK